MLPIFLVVTVTLSAAAQPFPLREGGRVTPVADARRFVGHVQSMTFADGSLWISCHNEGFIWRHQEGNLYRIDPHTFATVATWPISGFVAAGEGAVWVRHGPERVGFRPLPENQGVASKIDPASNRVVATVAVDRWSGLPAMQGSMVVGEGGVWLANRANKTVVRLDPRNGQVVATVPLGYTPHDLAIGEGAVWVLVKEGVGRRKSILRIDPKTNGVAAPIPVDGSTVRIAAGQGWLWVLEQEAPLLGYWNPKVIRIDPVTHEPRGDPILLGRTAVDALGVGPGGLWVIQCDPKSDRRDSMLCLVDPKTGRVKELTLHKGISVGAKMAFGDGAIWLGHGRGFTDLDRVQPRE